MQKEIELLKKYMAINLRKLRIESNISQEDLSIKSCVNVATIARYEAGTITPSLDNLVAILNVFNTSLYIFFDEIYENMYNNDVKILS